MVYKERCKGLWICPTFTFRFPKRVLGRMRRKGEKCPVGLFPQYHTNGKRRTLR